MRRLTHRERGMLGAALAAAVGVAAWMLIWLPIAGQREETAAEIAALRARLIASHGLLSAGRHYGEEVESLRHSVREREERLFSEEQASLLGARLQKLYKDRAETAGLSVKSEQILESEKLGEITVVPIEITVGGDTAQLEAFLAAIEADSKALRVDRFSIRVPNVLRPAQVTATVRISGFLIEGPAT